MTFIVLSALLISSLIYLYIGFSLGKSNKDISDLFPIFFKKNASVQTVDEFSSSTTATTVSLSTIILAYFEMAGNYGIFLLWTAITTSIGMILTSMASQKIWQKMSVYPHRPTMHEFLGVEFNSKTVALVASACTSIGFLLIFATELIVGSRFLAKFVPMVPEWATVVFLSGIGFIYTLFGGFRAVVKTDQLQMKFIWGLIVVLVSFYLYYIIQKGGLAASIVNIPPHIFDLSDRKGLWLFLIGIALMNIPTHISNMSIWQRISGAQNPETVTKGFRSSIWNIFFSWSFLALIACFAFMIVPHSQPQNLLTDLLMAISTEFWGKIVLFVVVLGLYGAMLSTASTNLIVVTHTISEDIIARFRKKSLDERVTSKTEFFWSRMLLVGSALFAIFLVEGLKLLGFSIADLVFSIYGGSLALFPPILIALYNTRSRLQLLSHYTVYSVILGFLVGWGIAIYGKITINGDLIFLAPTFSIGASLLILLSGMIIEHFRLVFRK
jgi:solute:Na+ symporter, SSS family